MQVIQFESSLDRCAKALNKQVHQANTEANYSLTSLNTTNKPGEQILFKPFKNLHIFIMFIKLDA